MNVQMENRLTGVCPGVDNRAIVRVWTNDLAGDPLHCVHEVFHQFSILRRERVERLNVPAWDDEQVHRRYRVDIPDDDDLAVFIHQVSGGGLVNDVAENTVGHILYLVARFLP